MLIKKNIIKNKYIIFSWTWLFFISTLTVNKYAPEWLNADILINSVMSLQKVTLYYWGQNRLVNVMPFIFSGITEPSINLFATILFTSLCFYFLLYYFSRITVEMLYGRKNDLVSLKVFILVSASYLFIFKPFAIFEISIGHIEYSLPVLLLTFASLSLLRPQNSRFNLPLLLFGAAMIFTATGLNPSTLIPAVFIAALSIAYKKKIGANEIFLIGASLLSFLIWDFESKKFGSMPYNEFKFEILISSLEKVFDGLLKVINLPLLLILAAAASIFNIINLMYFKDKFIYDQKLLLICSSALILFTASWFLVFSGSRWVEMSLFVWRYFIYAIFALFFLLSIYITYFISKLDNKISWALTGLIMVITCIFLIAPVSKFNQYKVFQTADALTASGDHLYAGNYWVVWPSVLRDMMQGYSSYGLTFRGDANRVMARNYVMMKIKANGHVIVFCLNDTVENCISQVNSIVGPLNTLNVIYIKEGVDRIVFSDFDKSAPTHSEVNK